jgi:cation diffusion facilitator CzcD-associated flavoprotein CzcO
MSENAVVIIGAGLGGLQAAIRLIMAGRRDFVILERQESVGGTWNQNRYPGLTCDVGMGNMAYSWDLGNISFKTFYPPPEEFCSVSMFLSVSKLGFRTYSRLTANPTILLPKLHSATD